MLQIENGNYYYKKGKKQEDIQLLYKTDINLEIMPGEILSILGPNGAGKTTLLKCMMGLLKWKKGDTILNGKPLSRCTNKEIWQQIGYVPQASKLAFSYSILDLVIMGRASYVQAWSKPSEEDRLAALEALELTGISHLADKSCSAVSGGELQLAMIARTLAADPKILVLDEPESHLDIHKQKIILETIQKLVKERGLACIINTHFPNHALYFGGKVLMIAKERPAITGPVKDIMTEENLLDYFGIEITRVRQKKNGHIYETVVPTYFGQPEDV